MHNVRWRRRPPSHTGPPPLPPYPRQGEGLNEGPRRDRRPGVLRGGRPGVRGEGRRGMAAERPAPARAGEEVRRVPHAHHDPGPPRPRPHSDPVPTAMTPGKQTALMPGNEDKVGYWLEPPDLLAQLQAEFGPLEDVCPYPRPAGGGALREGWAPRGYREP